MNCSIRIHCRLSALLEECGTTPQELAEFTGISQDRIQAYCADALREISLQEAEAILDALGCDQISDLFRTEYLEGSASSVEERNNAVREVDWESPCARAPGGRHLWYKDLRFSDSVYQEYVCRVCGHRITVIL